MKRLYTIREAEIRVRYGVPISHFTGRIRYRERPWHHYESWLAGTLEELRKRQDAVDSRFAETVPRLALVSDKYGVWF